jgi:aspartate/methionine/tyrosine aminotransferase
MADAGYVIRPINRPVPFMGVIRVVHEAAKLGFRNGHPDWCNLGQGQPEIGDIAGAPLRNHVLSVSHQDCAYGPVEGIDELREAVAEHYNRLFRRGKASQYRKENVAIASGGRLILSRLIATLGDVRLGHLVPDYTAYEDLIDYHRHRFTPVTLSAGVEDRFVLAPQSLQRHIETQRLDALLFSNPCNPTGATVAGETLSDYVSIARRKSCWLLLDEFYSHFVYDDDGGAASGPVSAAAFVDDVDRDPVVIVDGLTKGFRYPGLRLGWMVGPPDFVGAVARAASAIDGGPSTVTQRLAVSILEPERADQETTAVRRVFSRKRHVMLERLSAMGIDVPVAGNGTFYLWANLSKLPAPLNHADKFFRAALEQRVMTVPGYFFDVNPGRERAEKLIDPSWMRLSYGPPESNLILGLDRLEGMICRSEDRR